MDAKNNTNPVKISVIMPVYNAEQYLRQTLDSVLNQTFQDFELICVDDGSSDTSPEILKEYQEKDSRMKVFHQKNQFAGAARNHGMKKAKGEFFIFWDSDDVFEESALEDMYNQCVQDGADICICGANEFEEDLKQKRPAEAYLKEKYLPEKSPFYHKDIDKYLFYFATNVSWNKLIRSSLIHEHQLEYQQYRHGEDTRFILAVLFYAKKYTVVKKPLINYRVFNENSLTGRMGERPMDVLHSYEDTWQMLSKEPDFVNVEQSFRNKFLAGMMNDFKHLGNIDDFEHSFALYREKCIEWDFPEEEDYYINEIYYRRLMELLHGDVRSFLFFEYQFQGQSASKFRGKIKRQGERIRRQQKKIQLIRKQRQTKESELKEKNNNLQKKLEKTEQKLEKAEKKIQTIENSWSYKIGRILVWLPGKIKRIFGK